MNDTESALEIVRCVSCDGYGWIEDDDGEAVDCDWCGGVGYVYRQGSTDGRIPPADFDARAETLERLDAERLREMGYSGAAKKPWEQAIRKGTKGGQKPPGQ